MSGILTKWVVRQDHDLTSHDLSPDGTVSDETVTRWVEAAQQEYLGRCAALKRAASRDRLEVRTQTGTQPRAGLLGHPTGVVVTATATEFRPDSFTLSVRLRPGGGDRDMPVNATRIIRLADPATGAVHELGKEIRDELIALEHAAQHFN